MNELARVKASLSECLNAMRALDQANTWAQFKEHRIVQMDEQVVKLSGQIVQKEAELTEMTKRIRNDKEDAEREIKLKASEQDRKSVEATNNLHETKALRAQVEDELSKAQDTKKKYEILEAELLQKKASLRAVIG